MLLFRMQGCQLRKKPCIDHSGKLLADGVFLHIEEIAGDVEAKPAAEMWVEESSGRNRMGRYWLWGQAHAASALPN